MATETVAQAISGIRKEFPSMDGLDNEEDAKLFVIERILYSLGWNLFSPREMKKEFKVGKRRADYALNPNWPTAEAFIEAKSPTVKLNENHDYQLLNYCFQQAVDLGVLTNGRTWWLYLPMYAGPQGESLRWSQKRFCEIDIIDETIDGERKPSRIPIAFERFLAKEKVASGEAIEDARSEIGRKINEDIAKKGIVEAWNKIVSTPSEDLIKLLTDSTASLCSVKPNKPWVKEFFQNHRGQLRVSHSGHSEPKLSSNSKNGPQNGKLSFIFNDDKHSVDSWKEVLVKLCELIYDRHPEEFNKIQNVRGNKLYFSRRSDDLGDSNPTLIGNSGIFAATDSIGPKKAKERCQMVLREFGYKPEVCFRLE